MATPVTEINDRPVAAELLGRNRLMKVLWVYAHPDPRSLNGALRDIGIDWLRRAGHDVIESDLYAMGWNPVVDHADFAHDRQERLDVLTASEQALDSGTLSPDIRREQAKIRWADTMIVQFPLWWFGTPAILKGWFDRLFVQGFAQGVLDPETGRALRYGDGGLVGRRVLVITTVGANAATTGPRGIHGDLTEVLFPLLHGTLWYSGMKVVPPLVINSALRLTGTDYDEVVESLRDRLTTLPDTEPIPYRVQNGGAYDEHLVLQPDLAPGETGIHIHDAGEDGSAPVRAAEPEIEDADARMEPVSGGSEGRSADRHPEFLARARLSCD